MRRWPRPSPVRAPLQVYHTPSACSGPPGTSPRRQARAHSQERLERPHPRYPASAPRPHRPPHRSYPSTALSSGALFWRPLKPLQVSFRSSPKAATGFFCFQASSGFGRPARGLLAPNWVEFTAYYASLTWFRGCRAPSAGSPALGAAPAYRPTLTSNVLCSSVPL